MAVTPKMFVFFLSLSLAVSIQSDLSIEIGNKKIVVTEEQGNWYQANHACTALGMSLVSIESDAENTNLRNYLLDQKILGDGYWLSGTNLAASGTYTWLETGKKFNFAKWKNAEPAAGSERCVYASEAEFTWGADACTAQKFIICSRPLVPGCGITGRCKRNKSFFY